MKGMIFISFTFLEESWNVLGQEGHVGYFWSKRREWRSIPMVRYFETVVVSALLFERYKSVGRRIKTATREFFPFAKREGTQSRGQIVSCSVPFFNSFFIPFRIR